MNINCIQSVVPTLEEDFCNGDRVKTQCIISTKALTYLQLPVNSTLEDIIDNLIVSLADARNRIVALEAIAEDFETRITALE